MLSTVNHYSCAWSENFLTVHMYIFRVDFLFNWTPKKNSGWHDDDDNDNFIKWVDNLVLCVVLIIHLHNFLPLAKLARVDGNWNWKHLGGFRNAYPFNRYFMAQYYLAMQDMHVSYEHNEFCLSFIFLQTCLRWLNIKWVRIVIIQINVTHFIEAYLLENIFAYQ